MDYEQKYKEALCRAKTFYKRWIAWFEKQKDACDREYVDTYRRGIEDAFKKQGGQTQLGYEHEELPEKDLEDLFQALPESIVDEKSHQVYELCVYHYDGQCVVDYLGEIYHDSLYTFVGDTLYDAIEKAWNWLRKNSTGG